MASKLQTQILQYLKSIGWATNIIHADNGTPDILGCYRGRLFAIEVKEGTGRLSPGQVIQLEKIMQQDGYALVARRMLQVVQLIDIIQCNHCNPMSLWDEQDRKRYEKERSKMSPEERQQKMEFETS